VSIGCCRLCASCWVSSFILTSFAAALHTTQRLVRERHVVKQCRCRCAARGSQLLLPCVQARLAWVVTLLPGTWVVHANCCVRHALFVRRKWGRLHVRFYLVVADRHAAHVSSR
jgi:hypothetical protein